MADPKLAELVGEPIETYDSVYWYLEKAREKNPDGVAVIAAHQAPEHLLQLTGAKSAHPMDCLYWTHTQLHNAAVKLALGLKAKGVAPGSTAITVTENYVEWAILFYASMIGPYKFAPIDVGALHPARIEELQNFMARLTPGVVLVADENGAKAVNEAILGAGIDMPLRIIFDGAPIGSAGAGWTSFSEVAQSGDSAEESKILENARKPNSDATVVTLFTSGTSSGRPKGCPRSIRNTVHLGLTVVLLVDMDSNTKYLLTTANFRAIAVTLNMASWFAGGCCVIPGPAFTTASSLESIEKFGVTTMTLVPAQIHMFPADPSYTSRNLNSLTYVGMGGDMVTKDTLKRCEKAFPSAAACTGHGMTEGAGGFTWPFFGQPVDNIPTYGDVSPLGGIMKNSRLKIVDTETGETLKRGEHGELHYSSAGIIPHYLDNSNADSFYDDSEGRRWFKTGDLASVNEHGWTYILGRMKDKIKRAGIPIMPAALESCIDQFTGSESSVIGLPHPVLGQEPYAILQSLGGKSEAEIKQHVLEKFGKDYALAGATTLDGLGRVDWPLNASGKIVKITLVDEVMNSPTLKIKA